MKISNTDLRNTTLETQNRGGRVGRRIYNQNTYSAEYKIGYELIFSQRFTKKSKSRRPPAYVWSCYLVISVYGCCIYGTSLQKLRLIIIEEAHVFVWFHVILFFLLYASQPSLRHLSGRTKRLRCVCPSDPENREHSLEQGSNHIDYRVKQY